MPSAYIESERNEPVFDKVENSLEVRDIFAVLILTRHWNIVVDDSVVPEIPTSIGSRKAKAGEAVTGSGLVAMRVRR